MTTIVTGSSSGIGQEICKRFRERGWTTIGIAREEVHQDDLVADVSDYRQVIRTARLVEEKFKIVDLIVNCAGIFESKSFTKCDPSTIVKIIDTNLIGIMNVTHAFLPILRGRIINIASVSALHGIKNQAVYSASKAGIEGFANSLALENVNICTIYPGGVDTLLWNDSNPYIGDKLQLLKVEDIAEVVEFIATRPLRVIVKKIVMFPESETH